MNRIWGLVLLGLLGAAAGCDPPTTWQPFTSRDGKYSVNFPGTPQERPTPLGFAAVCEAPDGTSYQVSYFDLPVPEDFNADPGTADKYHGGIAVRAVGKGTAIANQRTTAYGLPARDIVFKSPDGKFFVRDKIFINGRRAFELWVVSQNQEKLGAETAQKFYESFQFVR